ncbi:MAG: biotin--[acetyl-CoA-carboxylase] ligase [Dehalococcoidia bacterium]|nr:biotin--[acetyl-CoA-carboxylase] ligase [Dehalococcoidia bacterium]
MSPFDSEAYQRLRTAHALGTTVHYREVTGSTMDDARTAADAVGIAGCGHVFVAGEQVTGRGRQGRHWVSPPGVGLYATFHLCPSSVEHAPLLTIVGALAVADAVSATAGLATQFKWPNDVQVRGRKLAGVVAESRLGARIDVFLGVGVNVRAVRPPDEIAAIATSIEREGAPPPRLELLLASLCGSLERWMERVEAAPDEVIAQWRLKLVTLGRHVRLATPGGEVEGDAVDVTPLGELVLRHADGRTAPYAAGDVTAV